MQPSFTSPCHLLRSPSCYIVISVTHKYTTRSISEEFFKFLYTWAVEHMVFFQNTSQECWLTNAPKNLAIALWVIYKKRKQWNRIILWGQFFSSSWTSLASFLPCPQLCLPWFVFVSKPGRGSRHGPKAEPIRCARRDFGCVTPATPCRALDPVPGWSSAAGVTPLTCPHPLLQHPLCSSSAQTDGTWNVFWAGLNKGLWLPVFSEGEKWRRGKCSDSFKTLSEWKWS